ncbi:MAG: sulfite exporter TauE/SafE family protein [Candidatus Omnitrophota bacterium]|nr:sulfite exporter TauE/SafE family protein [Candidatus Omnitrophota bacterium]
MNELIKIFIAGITLGNGPCLFICIPIILPYIGGLPQVDARAPTWKIALRFTAIFSISRLFAYSLLGFLSVVFYRFVFGLIGSKGIYLQLILGILIILIGLFYLLNINQNFILSNPFCNFLRAEIVRKSKFNMMLFGLLIGFSPCTPLLAILTYIAATTKDSLWGLLAGFSFGLGTLITPLIPLGTLIGFVVDKIKKSSVVFIIARIISAIILIYFGIRLILNLTFTPLENISLTGQAF